MKGNKLLKLTILFACLALMGVFGALALMNHKPFQSQQPDTIPKQSESPEKKELQENFDPEKKITNFLICGVDSSHDLTDAILIASLNTKTNELAILQIPRDTYIGNEDTTVSGKINSVYSHNGTGRNSIQALIDVVERSFRIPIDYYGIVTLEGFRDAIDAMGGIPMYVPRQIDYYEGMTLYEGDQVLSGRQCEWLVRYRAGYATGDIGRLDMQKNFLQALAKKVTTMSVGEIAAAATTIYPQIESDLSISNILSYLGAVRKLDFNAIEMHTVPGTGVMHNTYAVYTVDKESLVEILNEHFWQGSRPLTADDLGVEELETTQAPSYSYTQPYSQQPQYTPQPPVQTPEPSEPQRTKEPGGKLTLEENTPEDAGGESGERQEGGQPETPPPDEDFSEQIPEEEQNEIVLPPKEEQAGGKLEKKPAAEEEEQQKDDSPEQGGQLRRPEGKE